MADDIPDIIEPLTVMKEPNEKILVYEGDFRLHNDKVNIFVSGRLYFEWFPSIGVRFTGKTARNEIEILELSQNSNSYELIIDDLVFGECRIDTASIMNHGDPAAIEGLVQKTAVKGDRSIAVEKIHFALPNLRNIHGDPVRKRTEKGTSNSVNRIRLENDDYLILIDKAIDYRDLQKALSERGGYLLQFHGELTGKKGPVLYAKVQEILSCLNTFLSFVNGRRTSTLFVSGVHEEKIVWTDLTPGLVDTAKYVSSWADVPFIRLNDIWKKFYELWENEDDRDFLEFAIHWYVEANGNSGLAEGAAIMAQTALELLYNWLVIKNRKILAGRDAENISAANKIRLLLSQLNVGYAVPASFTQLQAFVTGNTEVEDALDAAVLIRNAIVHSQQEKRRKLSVITSKAKFEALQLCISYIELSLLYILGFKDSYFDRCGVGNTEADRKTAVPWK